MAALGGVYRNPAGAVRGWEAAAAAGFGSPEVPKLKCYRSAEELGGEGKEETDIWEGECPASGIGGFYCAGSVGGIQILGMLAAGEAPAAWNSRWDSLP